MSNFPASISSDNVAKSNSFIICCGVFAIAVAAEEKLEAFALEEALSCDVPLLVWNVKKLNQEYGSNYPPFPATTIPYWDNTCGEFFYEKEEFVDTLHKLEENLHNYTPRNYILNNLSAEICEHRFIQLFAPHT